MHIDEDTRVAETAQPVVSETTQPSETKIAQVTLVCATSKVFEFSDTWTWTGQAGEAGPGSWLYPGAACRYAR